jgi:hypothetical protein
MKFYLVARLARPDARSQKTAELPVIFIDRAQAQETCDALNVTIRKGEPGFIVEEHEEPDGPFGQSA